MAQSLSILVLGAGELGNAVLEALVKHPKRQGSVTVLLRESTINTQDAKKRKQNEHLKSLGIAFEAGDIQNNSVSELSAIIRPYDTVISCTGMGLPPGSQLKISKAIIEAGVSRYFPWQWGIDYDIVGAGSAQDLFDEQLEVRALLRGQTRTNWIIVSTGLFMSFLFLSEFGPVDLKNRMVRALGSWDTPVSVTTPEDIGIMAAVITYEPRDISHQVVLVAGDTVTYGQVADMVEKRFGSPFRREVWDVHFLKKRLADEPDDVMFKYQNVFGVGKGVAWGKAQTLNGQRGVALEDVEMYLQNMEL
ncbi:hypothetical protein BJ170DRAFT_622913 [Xylariales sp. AK1849]|nr:hypothetical protein BJ170DRAFT_622913 [Xylariales sp. AK1849]